MQIVQTGDALLDAGANEIDFAQVQIMYDLSTQSTGAADWKLFVRGTAISFECCGYGAFESTFLFRLDQSVNDAPFGTAPWGDTSSFIKSAPVPTDSDFSPYPKADWTFQEANDQVKIYLGFPNDRNYDGPGPKLFAGNGGNTNQGGNLMHLLPGHVHHMSIASGAWIYGVSGHSAENQPSPPLGISFKNEYAIEYSFPFIVPTGVSEPNFFSTSQRNVLSNYGIHVVFSGPIEFSGVSGATCDWTSSDTSKFPESTILPCGNGTNQVEEIF